MNLWIRSQDEKVLTICRELCVGGTYGNEIIENDIRSLGTYKTKERALEVLDEIQNILKPKYILDTSSIKPDGAFYEENGVIFQKYNANAEIKELSTFVYEMPKE